MSARRKGKPQQRKEIETLEPSQDLLTCGGCQTEFLLTDICKFIEHKTKHCKQCDDGCDVSDKDPPPPGDTDTAGEVEPVISNRCTTSIYAPITRKETPELREKLSLPPVWPVEKPPGLLEQALMRGSEQTPRHDSQPTESSLEKLLNSKRIDTGMNTIFSEPSHFVCGICKSVYSSSWFLLQHVQNTHNMNVYVPDRVRTPSPPPQVGAVTSTGSLVPLQTPPQPLQRSPNRQSPISASTFSSSVSPFVFTARQPFPRPPLAPISPLAPDAFLRMAPPFTTPPAFDHPNFAFLPAPTFDNTTEDYYSQRLRQLAHPPSPTACPPPPLPTTESVARSLTRSEEDQRGAVKACEFCGKCFRFQSNLIVHRRSHTGEKPYKCATCPHACTQASKLKRHMRTHVKPNSSMNFSTTDSVCSSGSESKVSKDDEDEEEEEEEMEEEEIFDSVPRKLAQEEPTDLSQGKKSESTPTDLSLMKSESVTEGASDEGIGHEQGEQPMDQCHQSMEQHQPQRASMLSEMMANSGLGNIQQYKEAFKQAMAEHEDDEDCEDALSENGLDVSDDTKEETSSEDEQQAKRLKPDDTDSATANSTTAASTVTSCYSPSGQGSPMYPPGIWFPPPVGHPAEMFRSPFSRRDMFALHVSRALPENGLTKLSKAGGCVSTHPSLGPALSPAVSPAPHTLLTAGYSPSGRRRNDTCEFCGKIFKNCSNLTVHRRSHTGEKPYKCGVCNYACAQSSKLTRHMKTHGRLGKDIYCCKFCSMPFSVPGTLEKHMKKCVESHAPWAATLQFTMPVHTEANGETLPTESAAPLPPAAAALPPAAAPPPSAQPVEANCVDACKPLETVQQAEIA